MGRRLIIGVIAFAMVLLSLPLGAKVALAIDGGSGTVSLTALDTAYTQNFNTLTSTPDAALSNLLPTGWMISEGGTSARNDGKYAVGTGSSGTGDHYAYGTPVGNADRALGALRSGTLIPIFGASFTNDTGVAVTKLEIVYTGEQWRLGAVRTPPDRDRIDFQYSLNATSLSTGTWTDADALDFSSPITSGNTGALNGNDSANRKSIAASIFVAIPAGATLWVRWIDVDVPLADDGMAVDDFSLTPRIADGPPSVTATSPQAGASNVPVFANVAINFSESVNVADPWFTISCGISLAHNASVTGGPVSFLLDPTSDFAYTETCTVTVNAVRVTDQDLDDPPDNMAADYVFSFTTSAPPIPIHAIQGSGVVSPYAGTTQTTIGIVTAAKGNGFFLQAPESDYDADPNTSEGIFVFTSSAPPAAAAVGNRVQVTGQVQEFIPSQDPYSPQVTEIGASPSVALISTGIALPAPITITSADMNPAGGISQLEKYEGMRVHVNSLTVTGPADGNVNETTAIATLNGLLFGVLTGTPRPFREPGIEVGEPNPPAGSPATSIPKFDANPERLRVDSLGIGAIDASVGDVITDLTGPLDFGFRTYSVYLTEAAIVSHDGVTAATPVRLPRSYEYTIASSNLERFFDTANDPDTGDPILTTAALDKRLAKASLMFRNVLRMPDVIGVEEMENLTTLQALARRINTDAVAAGGPDPGYVACLFEGNDVGGIDSGFLIKSSRVTLVDCAQYSKNTSYINPNNGQPELLNDRPPVVLRVLIQPAIGTAYPVTVIVNHLRSLSSINSATDGNRVRTKRRAQAEDLANLIQALQTADPNEHIVSVGDYNAFQFSDGYVDSLGTIKGTPTPAANVALASLDLVNPDLVDLVDTVPAAQQYSFLFDGNAQELDHVLITQNLTSRFVELQYGRNNADFSESYRNDATRSERISDHDPIVAYFTFPD